MLKVSQEDLKMVFAIFTGLIAAGIVANLCLLISG